MTVQEWQEQFLTLVYGDKSNNIFPPALIRMIANASDEDAEEFKEFVKSYFKQYESATTTVLGSKSKLRKLILAVDVVEEEVE